MSDLFNEIDEEVRRDKVLDFWMRHRNALIALAVLIVLGTAGYTSWQKHVRAKAEATAARFEAAIEDSRAGRNTDAEASLRSLVADAPDGYKVLTRLRLASEEGKLDTAKGIAAFDALALDTSVPDVLRDLARYRAAVLASDTLDQAALSKRLEPLTAKIGPWTGLAQELIGLAALKSGDFDGAGRMFDAIAIDRAAPTSLKQRVDIYLGLIRGGPVKTSP